jgi:hypothetical protein
VLLNGKVGNTYSLIVVILLHCSRSVSGESTALCNINAKFIIIIIIWIYSLSRALAKPNFVLEISKRFEKYLN